MAAHAVAPIRVAIACDNDPTDPRAYSGTLASVLACVRGMDGVAIVATIDCSAAIAAALLDPEDAREAFFGGRYTDATLEAAARAVDRALSAVDAEVLFVADGNACVPRLRSEVPVVWWNDCTWACWLHPASGYYHVGGPAGAAAVSLETRRFLAAWDAAALKRASAALLASDWAVRITRIAYGPLVARATRTAPYGAARAESLPSAAESLAASLRRTTDACVVLFVASERGWAHKGGATAVAAVAALRERPEAFFRRATLVCCGAPPPPDAPPLPPYCAATGWCDRDTPAGRAAYRAALEGAHVLCVPSRADFYGVTLVEALAHGVPAVASAAGGAATIVRHGVTGALLAPGAGASAYATAIADLLGDGGRRGDLSRACRADHDGRLDWRRAAAALGAAFASAREGRGPVCTDERE